MVRTGFLTLIVIASQLLVQPVDARPLPLVESPAPQVQRVTTVYDTLWVGGADAGTGLPVVGGVWDFDDGTPQGWTSVDLVDVGPMWRYDPDFNFAEVLLPGAEADSLCWPGGLGYGNYWRQSLLVDGPVNAQFSYTTDSETEFDFTYVYRRNASTGARTLLGTFTGSAQEGTQQGGVFSGSASAGESIEVLFASDVLYSDARDFFAGFLDTQGGFVMHSMSPTSGWYVEVGAPGARIGVESLAGLSPQPTHPSFGGSVLLAADPAAGPPHPAGQAEVLISNPVAVPAGAGVPGLVVELDRFLNTPPGAAPYAYGFGLRHYPWTCPETGAVGWSVAEESVETWVTSDVDGPVLMNLETLGSERLNGALDFLLADVDSVQLLIYVHSTCEWLGGVPAGDCDLADATPYFDNIRVGFLFAKDVFADVTSPPLGDTGDGQAVAWGDYDGDGDDDIFLANASSGSRLFENQGGTFTDATAALPAGSANAGIWADFDVDGDLDLYLVRNGANAMLQNDGGSFADVTAGPLGLNADSRAAAAADYDGDGDLDLFIANTSMSSSRLLRYDGIDWADVTPAIIMGEALSAAWGDYDNDGDPDLVTTQSGTPTTPHLYRNDGAGEFAEVPLANDLATSAIWADVDTDGDPDIVTAGPVTRYLENTGGDVFVRRIAWLEPSTSVSAADFDLDGDIDLHATRSDGFANLLLANDDGLGFLYFSAGAVANTGDGRASAWADYDADGDPDIYLVNDSTANRLLRNDQEVVPRGPTTGNRLLVRPLTEIRAPAIGARVRIVAGGMTQIREISGGAGNGSQDAPIALFGLGATTTVDSVITTFPSGDVVVETDVPANVPLEVMEPVPTIALNQTSVELDIPVGSRVAVDVTITNSVAGADPLTWNAAEVVPCDFLTLSPTSGSIQAGSSAALELAINVEGLGDVELACDILITTNDPNQPEVTVPVTVTTRPVILPVELDVVYALSNSQDLAFVDESSGLAVVPIGGTEVPNPGDLAISLLGEMYATSETTTRLYRIDGETGASVDIGDLGATIPALTVDDQGTIWGGAMFGDLYTIDPVSLTPTLVGNTGTIILDLTFDHVGGRLLLFFSFGQTAIYEVDRTTGVAEFLVVADRELDEFVVDTNGDAFGIVGSLYVSLDLGTGQTIILGSIFSGPRALATWPSITAVDVPAPAPSAYTLIPAAPNPFNPRTRIGFTMPEAGRARIDVFDAQGRRVASLTDGVHAAGRHTVVFDADGLGSGVYFYRVEMPEFRATRKMTLLK